MRITAYNVILIILLSCLIIACSKDEFCAEPTESLANLGFYYKVGRLLNDTSVIGFSAKGNIDYDSLLYDSVNISSFELPLSAIDNSCTFIMSFSIPDTLIDADTIIYYSKFDTVSISYIPVLYFISQSCGFTYHYQIDSIISTNNIIDTILINSDLITTKDNENFKVLL